ncbi:MAG: isoprenyl transferase [Alloprevotella sp.]|nr:isoprenyl transferase [Alloprevotella sp.]
MTTNEPTTYQERLDLTRLPRHVAIIMDGNGRWAKQRGLDRSLGHQEGVNSVRRITTLASNLGLDYLTLYTFSTENWNRPPKEVAALMTLILNSLEEELFMKNNVRFRVIGDMSGLSAEVSRGLLKLQDRTAHNTGLQQVLAINYSARWELTEAVRRISDRVVGRNLRRGDITDKIISSELSTAFMPDPDLLIRTGGEQRLSNYLLWQSAYTELYFCDTYWPDFTDEAFCQALYEYQQRERRFGKTSEQVATQQ